MRCEIFYFYITTELCLSWSNPRNNLSLTGKEPQVCVSETTCCTKLTEDSLRVRAAKNLKTLLQTEYVAAKSSLLSLYDDLKG